MSQALRSALTSILFVFLVTACGGGGAESPVTEQNSGGPEAEIPTFDTDGSLGNITSNEILLKFSNDYLSFTDDYYFWSCESAGVRFDNWHSRRLSGGAEVSFSTHTLKEGESFEFTLNQISDNSISMTYGNGYVLILSDIVVDESYFPRRMTLTINAQDAMDCEERLLVEADKPDAWSKLIAKTYVCYALGEGGSRTLYGLELYPEESSGGQIERWGDDSIKKYLIDVFYSGDTSLTMAWYEETTPNDNYIVNFDDIEFGDENAGSFNVVLDIRPAALSNALAFPDNGAQLLCERVGS